MPYTKVHDAWEDLPSTVTPINAAALDQIEAGIADAQEDADSANTSIGDHLADTSAAHAASAVSFSPTGTVGAANVQSAIAEVASDAASDLTAHTGDSSGAHAASAISFSPTGSVVSSNVQAAIAEVAAEAAAGSGVVDTVVAGEGIDVNSTDPSNPVVSVEAGAYAEPRDGVTSVTRDGSNLVTAVTAGGMTYTSITRSGGQVSGFTLNGVAMTVTRDGDGRVTGIS